MEVGETVVVERTGEAGELHVSCGVPELGVAGFVGQRGEAGRERDKGGRNAPGWTVSKIAT